MTYYDETVLQTFADTLYDRADSIVVVTALKYGAVGFLAVWLGLSPHFLFEVGVSSRMIEPTPVFMRL